MKGGVKKKLFLCRPREIFPLQPAPKVHCGLAVMPRRIQDPHLGVCSPILLLSEELSAERAV